MIVPGTTPTKPFVVDADLSGLKIYLTFKNGNNLLTKTDDDLSIEYEEDKTTITAILTQEETLRFKPNTTVEIQVRAVDASGYPAVATTVASESVSRILLNGVLP